LPGVATGARGNDAALRGIAPQDADLIVIGHQALKLAQHHLPHKLRQMIIQRIPVYLKSVIFATLALIDQGIVVVLRQGGGEGHPATPGGAQDLARAMKSRRRESARACSAQVTNPFSPSRVTANNSLRVTMV
jgi:hypothetical protein